MKAFDETFIPAFLSNNIIVFRTFCGAIIIRSFDIHIFSGSSKLSVDHKDSAISSAIISGKGAYYNI